MNAPAPVAPKKRRLSLQPLASAAPAEAPAAAPAEAPIPRTQLQLGQEFDKCVDALIGAVDAWREVSHAQLVHADVQDIDAIIVGGRQLKRAIEAYQAKAKADQDAAAAAEAQRRVDLVPVAIDKREARLYKTHRAKLTGGNTVLYKCPLATGDDGVCGVGAVPFGPGLKAIVQRHIARVHLKSAEKRKDLHGLGEAVAEGWVVA